MARKTSVRKAPKRPTRVPARRKSAHPRATAPSADALLGRMKGTDNRTVGGVQMDIGRAGSARVKRTVYPVGFRWSKDMKPVVGSDWCMHAHVGFLARGRIHMEFADGCVVEFAAPQIVAIEPGHDGWVVGREPAVLIEFDFERESVARLGMPDTHRHP